MKKSILDVFLIWAFMLVVISPSQAQQFTTKIADWNAYVHLPDDYDANPTKLYPTIIFIPGVGEVGSNVSSLLVHGPNKFVAGGDKMAFTVNGKVEKPIVISLQPPGAWPGTASVKVRVDEILSRWRVDPNRVYGTGLSMGGWAWQGFGSAYPNVLAAMVVMSALKPDANFDNLVGFARGGGKWWGFEGDQDYRQMDIVRDAMNGAVPGSARYYKYHGGHCCWDIRYDPTWTDTDGESIYTWMLKIVRDGGGPVNQAPVANAGSEQTITLPTNNVQLGGSGTDKDGTISKYVWSQSSGPSTATIASPSSANTQVSNLQAGTYVFSLQVTDNDGATGTATVSVIVKIAKAPVVHAGADTSITLPENVILLNGNAYDPVEEKLSYQWKQDIGPSTVSFSNATGLSTQVSGLEEGSYVLLLTAINESGLSTTSSMKVVVNAASNQAPVADAGSGQTITLPTNSVTLTGSGTDTDGSISEYAWSQSTGQSTATIVSPSSANTKVSDLQEGTYTFNLLVTDNKGDTASASVNIIVKAGAAQSPVVDAGADATITLPDNQILLNGSASDPGGQSLTYKWSQDSGPSSANFTDPSSVVTRVNDLVQGTYTFLLTGTNESGLSTTSSVKVIVNSEKPGDCHCDVTFPLHEGDKSIYFINGSGGTTVKPGDRVCIKAGNYTHIYFSGLVGTASKPITIVNCGGQVVVANDFTYLVTFRNSDYFRLTGTGDPNIKYGFKSYLPGKMTSATISTGFNTSNFEFDHIESQNASAGFFCKVDPADCKPETWYGGYTMGHVSFHDNYIHGTAHEGFYLGNSNISTKVKDCSTGKTIEVASVLFDGIKIYNNIVDSTGWDGIQVSGGQNAEIYDNRVTNYGLQKEGGQQTGIILAAKSYGTVHHNYIANGVGNGLALTGYKNSTAYDNVIINSGWDGIVVDERPGPGKFHGLQVYIFNNTIVSPYRIGIYVMNTYGSMADGNKIYNNIIANPSEHRTYTLKNFINGFHNADVDTSHNLFANKVSDVKFVDIAHLDAHLLPTSPAINAGMDLSDYKVLDDLDYVSRPQGSAYDIGAYEYNFGTPPPNRLPNVDAGKDQTVRLPENSVNLKGTAKDPDGQIDSVSWKIVSGPTGAVLTGKHSLSATASALSIGTYVFKLTAWDNEGDEGVDSVTVMVKAANMPPIADAGPDRNITLPTNTTSLAGKGTDEENAIASFKWSKISGPGTFNLVNDNQAGAIVNSLVEGIYKFMLKVTDEDGLSGLDTMTVTVTPKPNVPPTANAGTNQTIQLPTNSVQLSGSGKDTDGTIKSYSWKKNSGPSSFTIESPNSAATKVSRLVEGVYTFEVTVTDDKGATDKSTITITVKPAPNKAPTVDAGNAQTITMPASTATLTGSASDEDGSITAYEWTKVSGPASFAIANKNQAETIISGLTQGIYEFRLTATDDKGATASATTHITVKTADNTVPVAHAGDDMTITLPTNEVSLTGQGTDGDGTIVSYAWVKISGPNEFTIESKNSATTKVKGLTRGIYIFELTVEDDAGDAAKDVVKITVNPVPNKPPVAGAGQDRIMTLPTQTTSLTGSGSDADGSVVAYLWTKVSGPSNYEIVNPSSPVTDVTKLTEGVYEFQLKVTDNDGAQATDIMKVTVKPMPNQAPVANAGPDRSITLPANTASLSGSGTDADGTITTYLWTKIQGSSNYHIVNASSAVTDVTNLTDGVYKFRLKVTDNEGASSTDDVTIIVYGKPNEVPTANAGGDITIVSPVDSVLVKGKGTDPEGGKLTYNWRQISGPSKAFIHGGDQATVLFKNLVAGVYQFELVVTDDKGAKAKDLVDVTVVLPRNTLSVSLTEIKVFPNPTTGQARIEINNAKKEAKFIMVITDSYGRIIERRRLNTGGQYSYQAQIDLSNQAKGVYIVSLSSGGNMIGTVKVIKID